MKRDGGRERGGKEEGGRGERGREGEWEGGGEGGSEGEIHVLSTLRSLILCHFYN